MATNESPLKVLFFSPYFYPYVSGLTYYPYRIFTEHRERMNVTCLTFRHDAHLKWSEAISPNMTIERMPFLMRISKGFISPQSWILFAKQLQKHDVVFLNLPSVEGVLLALLAYLRGTPVVSVLHCEVLLPPGILNRIINSVLHVCVYIQLALSQAIIVYTTDYYENKKQYNPFRNKMHIILPPIHTSAPDITFARSLTEHNPTKYRIGFCGRIAYEKNIVGLIRAASSIPDVELIFAGPSGKEVVGESKYYSRVLELLKQTKIPHRFLGTLSGSNLSAFYKSIDVLALPSINKTEAFGMVQVEAMLQGTPVVSSDLPGVRIPVSMTGMGVVVPPGNEKGLTIALKQVLAHRNIYTNPQKANKARALFSSQKTVRSVYNLLHTYAAKKKS